MTPDEAMAEALLMARGPLGSLAHEERVAVTLAAEVLRLREQCAHLERLALRGRAERAKA